MKKVIFTISSLFIFVAFAFTQVTIEDFEGTPLTWSGDGTFAVVDNPTTDGLNASAKCGSYTKSGSHAYSLLLGTLSGPLDLSTNNELHMMINAPVDTKVIFKLEGGGDALEVTKTIASTNVWKDYVFDMSGAKNFTGIDKIVIFFDPGVETSDDTYLFDNIIAYPEGPCAGTTPVDGIVDDFECQRNVEYGAGWDALTAIANPHSGGINTSAMVGQYNDPEGEPWLPLVADFGGPMDLSTRNILKVKLWSSMAVPMLFKLEGGVSPAKEVWQDITTTGEWVEYTIDFSDQAAANHEKLSIFFNGGVDAGPNDVYYIDDIVFEEAPAAPALEDFEPQKMGWGPAGGNATEHGSFAVVANPDMTGVNTSANVGEYTKGTAEYSTLAAVFPAGLDLSTKPQLNLQVWAPAGATSVIMKLSSPLQGFKEVTQDISATETWVDMGFNFEAFSDITDFESVNLIFNPGTAEAGVKFLFDNLTQSESTVDPCMGVAPIPNIINDFECQVNYSIGAGNDRLTTVNNPHVTAENNSTKVGEYLDPNDEWSALGFESGSSWDLSVYNQFKIKIYSSAIVPLLFKLEGGTSPAKEVSMQVTEVDKWVEYTVDFSDQAMEDHARIVVFFNAGVNPGQEDTYYIDDVLWQRANYSGCVGDYESPNTTFMHQYFANGHIEQEDNKIHTVDNPAPGGINTSTTVAKFVRASDCDPWAGAFSPLGAPIEFGANKTIRVKVYMDHIGNFGMKTEASATGAANIELSVPNTKVNEWEELTFDFSAAPDDAQFMTLTVFVDLGIDATGVDVTSYFDDIIIGDGSCLPDGLFTPTDVASFELSPNPVSTELRIDNLEDLRQLSITNLLGQVVSTIKTSNNTTASFDVSQLKSGIYFLTGYDNNGQLIANAKFVKE